MSIKFKYVYFVLKMVFRNFKGKLLLTTKTPSLSQIYKKTLKQLLF